MVHYEEEMAELASQMGDARSATSSGGKWVSTAGAIFSIDGNEVGQTLEVIIIDAVRENQYFTAAYDPENPAPPVCFAFGRGDAAMVPHNDTPDPQAKTCATCPKNVFGSAGEGRKGKACKNTMRLALISADDMDDVENAEVRLLKVSPTNLANYAKFIEKLKTPELKLGKNPHPARVVCRLTVRPSRSTQISLDFDINTVIDDAEVMGKLITKIKNQIPLTEEPWLDKKPPQETVVKNTKIKGRK